MSLRFGIQVVQMWFTDSLWTLQGTLLKNSKAGVHKQIFFVFT